ncbi:MAG: serine hydrolase [Phycisphaerae bacterium]|nr:serine hydrolase [Phycisphaerae bacterium]
MRKGWLAAGAAQMAIATALGWGAMSAAAIGDEAAKAAAFPSDAEIGEILKQAVDKDKRSIGIVVGLISPAGTRVIAHGSAGSASSRPLDGDTIFEIGSITKTFTGTLLADMVRAGEVKAEDTIRQWLPKTCAPPKSGAREMTLRDLATHTSGLQRMPTNHQPADITNPYADYTTEQLHEWLSDTDVMFEIGSQRVYSNVGYGLLGHLLEVKSGKTYAELVKERITGPLGMSSTTIALSDEQKARLAQGHDEKLKAMPNWDLPAMAGAGALRSSVNDMLKYAAANLQIGKTPLEETVKLAQRVDIPIGAGKEKTSLAWGPVSAMHGTDVVWHNGGTGGYHSVIAMDPATKRGVVVLSNCSASTDDIAFHLLTPKYPLRQNRIATKLPKETLERYVGVYEISEGVYREVTRYRDRLFIQRTGQPAREIEPEFEGIFFNNEVGFRVRFEGEPGGKATGMVLTQADGTDSPAKRVDRPLSQQRRPVDVDVTKYDGLEGNYRLAPELLFTVKRDGDKLMVGLTGQPTFEVYPEAEDKFYYTVVDAQLVFVRGADGKATKLVLHQNGEHEAVRE